MPNCANIAATLMEHLCTHDWHGYTQGAGRWGDGEGKCYVEVPGEATYAVEQGDRDCSSAVIDCWRQAVYYTDYRGCFDAATYTGNMRSVFVNSGLFVWRPMGDGYIAQRGDIYLNEASHTAMCISAVPDMLAEFSINELGTITGGAVGDQTGGESRIVAYYDFPWDGILQYNHKADGGSSSGGNETTGGSETLDKATVDWIAEAVSNFAVGQDAEAVNGPNGDSYLNNYNAMRWTYWGVVGLQTEVAALSEALKALAENQGADPDKIAEAISNAVEEKLESLKINIDIPN